MTLVQRLAPSIDAEAAKKAFDILSGLIVLAIPVQAFFVYYLTL